MRLWKLQIKRRAWVPRRILVATCRVLLFYGATLACACTLWAAVAASATSGGCAHACPAGCSCGVAADVGYSVFCERAGLTAMPPAFPCLARSLHLTRNRLRLLPERAFGSLALLQQLFLNHNNVTFLTPGAFRGLPSVSMLSLAHNRHFTALHTRSFEGLPSLRLLDLSACNLFSLPDRILLELHALRELRAWGNHMRRVPGAVQGLSRLSHLYLGQNNIEAVAYNSLHGLVGLVLLDLQGNHISVVHNSSFHDCSHLEDLYLNDNEISSLPPLAFIGLLRLRLLNLGGNRLRAVTGSWFWSLSALRELYLDRNELSTLDAGAFRRLGVLNSLHLNHNNLTWLSQEALAGLTSLQRIYLFRNPWHCTCALRWLRGWSPALGVRVSDVTCASPESAAGLELSAVPFRYTDARECRPGPQRAAAAAVPARPSEGRLSAMLSRMLLETFKNTSGAGNVSDETNGGGVWGNWTDGATSASSSVSSSASLLALAAVVAAAAVCPP
ncbi:nyctalopin-like [Lampetra fluviatilis]